MDAPILRFGLIALSLLISTGATFQTRNFTVTAPTSAIAQQVGEAAEEYRRDLATFWLGQPLPNWSRPCKLRVQPGTIGAGGETTFQFIRGPGGNEVVNWNMRVQGSLERILDSVLPHEVNHTIFACHFRRPLPRWADEGAATLFEHRSEQMKQLELLNQVIKNDREFIALPQLLNMKEYPKQMRAMLILYAEGFALVDFLVQQGGRQKYLKFLADGERIGWEQAIAENYDHDGVTSLQENWQGWVIAGMPRLNLPAGQMLADNDPAAGRDVARPEILERYPWQPVLRGQSPEAGEATNSAVEEVSFAATVPKEEANAPFWVSSGNVPDKNEFKPAAAQPGGRGNSGHSLFSSGPTIDASGETSRRGRRASFEAPRPAPRSSNGSQPGEQPAKRTDTSFREPVTRPSSRLESTNHRRNAPRSAAEQAFGRQLPQERSAESGDIPQWAGFPGQQELF